MNVFADLFRTKCLRTAKIMANFRDLLLFRNKARNAVRSRKNAGNKPKCRISLTIAGRFTLIVFSRAESM